MRKYLLFFLCFLMIGCASTKMGVGTRTWHEARLTELREALVAGEISTEKYLELKNETDKIRLEYSNERSRDMRFSHGYSRPHFGFGFGTCHPFCH
ncbi:MAG: hypothetical protein K8I00_04920 [Candidatus Omnitrophica bacterium]|nr:hypothetical protein [Candidatus Omnitrophota bacterium]